jgi:hypothetical protein
MDALQAGAVHTYALHMVAGAASVILNEEGSRLEYTPSTGKLEVVLRSRGLLLTGLSKVMVCYGNQKDKLLYLSFSDDTLDTLGSFFNSEYWRHLITGHTSLDCAIIKGTPTTRGSVPLGQYQVIFRRGSTERYICIRFEFSSALVEQGLSWDREILREQEYIHEYTKHSSDAGATAGLIQHRANLAALQERALAFTMGSHPRLGGSSIWQGLDKDLFKDILSTGGV